MPEVARRGGLGWSLRVRLAVVGLASVAALVAAGGGASAGRSGATTASNPRGEIHRPTAERPGHSHRRCYQPREARVVHPRGGDGPAPAFSPAFSALKMTLETSVDEGIDPLTLQVPIAIEKVCGIKRKFALQARRLAGNDGIALVQPETSVYNHGAFVQGDAVIQAFEEADTATIRAQLAPLEAWGEDEDGNRIPTFTAKWIKITD